MLARHQQAERISGDAAVAAAGETLASRSSSQSRSQRPETLLTLVVPATSAHQSQLSLVNCSFNQLQMKVLSIKLL